MTLPQCRRRFAFVLLGSEGYGIQRVWRELICSFDSENSLVSTIVLGDIGWLSSAPGQSTKLVVGGISAGRASATGALGKIGLLISRLRKQVQQAVFLYKAVKGLNLDALVVQSPLEVLMVGIVGKMAGVSTFWLMPNSVSSGYLFDLNRRLYKYSFRHLNVFPIANSYFTASTLGRGASYAQVVHLGVSKYEFSPFRNQLNRSDTLESLKLKILESGAVSFGIFARITPEKGQLQFIKALIEFGDSSGMFPWLILAGGPIESEYCRILKRLADSYGRSDRIVFLGPVSEVADLYRTVDVVVNSRVDPEPFGLSVIEAMMSGRPVLAHSAGGPGETVIDGVTGWLTPAADVCNFRDAIQRAISHQSQWEDMGRAAMDHALANFSTERFMANLRSTIDRLLETRTTS